MNYLIFTDLDGTLLHPRTYSFEAAQPALDMVKERGIPLIFISSKTRPEVELWRSRLFNEHPFIVENGGGIFIPRGYFPFPVDGVAKDGYQMIALGLPYDEVRSRFAALREKLGIAVRGFGDMTPEEVMDLTGLTHEEALLAKQRDFGEPFVFSKKTEERFLAEIEGAGLTWTRGLLFHIMGDHHKGRAAKILRKLYERQYGSVTTIGIGDSLNDLPFLLTVDRPVLVRKLSGLHEAKIDMPGLLRTNGVGPAGWNEAVTEILKAAPSRP
jgi:mannosyl-3-phosphoglycerate phosphatase